MQFNTDSSETCVLSPNEKKKKTNSVHSFISNHILLWKKKTVKSVQYDNVIKKIWIIIFEG